MQSSQLVGGILAGVGADARSSHHGLGVGDFGIYFGQVGGGAGLTAVGALAAAVGHGIAGGEGAQLKVYFGCGSVALGAGGEDRIIYVVISF